MKNRSFRENRKKKWGAGWGGRVAFGESGWGGGMENRSFWEN